MKMLPLKINTVKVPKMQNGFMNIPKVKSASPIVPSMPKSNTVVKGYKKYLNLPRMANSDNII
jgi:hypothetical protein